MMSYNDENPNEIFDTSDNMLSVRILNSPQRNLSPSHNNGRRLSRSRSRSYDHRSRSRNRSRSPRKSRVSNERSKDRSRERNNNRQRRSDHGSRRSNRRDGNQIDRELGLKYRWEKTVYVSNIPYDTRWTDLKDLFRDKVGDIMYCEVFEKDGRSQGVGAIEFKTENDAERAVKLMHQYEIGGRKMSVRIDGEGFKTRQAKEIALETSSSNNRSNRNHNETNKSSLSLANAFQSGAQNNLLGILSGVGNNNSNSAQTNLLNQLANQLKVEGPVTNRLFVASLDYKVDEEKLKEVFGLAGKVQMVQLFRDRDGKSRGLALVEYDTPMDALNAVSMFNQQTLMDRQMTVRFDTKPPSESENEAKQSKLPSGLKSIGKGLNLSGGAIGNGVPGNLAGALLNGMQQQQQSQTPDLNLLSSLGINLNGTAPSLMSGLLNQSTSSQPQALMASSSSLHQNGSSRNTTCKVFVKNIPYSWDERKLKEKFRRAGCIEYAEVKMKNGKSQGCGLIRFTNSDQAVKGVELFNGSRFEGRSLQVNLDRMAH